MCEEVAAIECHGAGVLAGADGGLKVTAIRCERLRESDRGVVRADGVGGEMLSERPEGGAELRQGVLTIELAPEFAGKYIAREELIGGRCQPEQQRHGLSRERERVEAPVGPDPAEFASTEGEEVEGIHGVLAAGSWGGPEDDG